MKINKIIVNKLTKITLLENENYTFINSAGELVQNLEVKIQGNKLVIKDLNTGESIELENYQQAHLVTLDSVQLTRATAYVVHFSTYTPSNSSSRNSSDQPAAVNFPFILC
ncbi:hypothetical protein Q7424_05950, partial [Glaesserella parasuis]|nr:hypothetical protein [Glaesserella parasuis]MDP0011652.1 hypothetical protein [Glaesserella parasuis]